MQRAGVSSENLNWDKPSIFVKQIKSQPEDVMPPTHIGLKSNNDNAFFVIAGLFHRVDSEIISENRHLCVEQQQKLSASWKMETATLSRFASSQNCSFEITYVITFCWIAASPSILFLPHSYCCLDIIYSSKSKTSGIHTAHVSWRHSEHWRDDNDACYTSAEWLYRTAWFVYIVDSQSGTT